MHKYIAIAAVTAVAILPGVRAAVRMESVREFSLPDRLRNLVDSQDEYFDALQRLEDADAAVIRARESAMKEAQSSPEYIGALKAVDQSYQAYSEKKNALVAEMEKKDPVCSRMKSQVAQIDAQIESAGQNPATTQEQFEELYRNRETFQRQWHQLENDAMERAGLTPVRQAWMDASKKLSDLQEKLRTDVEGTERLKAAVAEANTARSAVEEARAAIGGNAVSEPAQAVAGDLLCKSARPSFAGNDAWWTYGWTSAAGSKAAVASSPAGGGGR